MPDSDSDDSDEWGQEELVIPPKNASTAGENKDANKNDGDGGDEFWAVEASKPPEPEKPKAPVSEGSPMIIVDITQIDENMHSKFDRNSVNDATAASALRKKIEANYEDYAKNASLLSDGTVIPCGSSVWRGALVQLRDERQGHYFAPIFPPKK
jgi:hypothetical protein